MKRLIIPLIAFFMLAFASMAFAHGGGLDAYGGHHNRKAGGYHVHRGPLAGKHYASKEEMLQDLRKLEASKASASTPTPLPKK